MRVEKGEGTRTRGCLDGGMIGSGKGKPQRMDGRQGSSRFITKGPVTLSWTREMKQRGYSPYL